MNAIIQTGGKQYNVKEGDIIRIEKLPQHNAGDDIIFDKVLFVKKGDNDFVFGAPYIELAQVNAQYMKEQREKKITIFKMKRRKGYRKKQGHRQTTAQIQIKTITLS